MSKISTRRGWFSRIAASATGLILGAGHVTAQQQQATLKQQLEFGLRARRPEEFAFIQTIVTMVEQGQLPSKLVTVSFNWARQRNGKYPYQYFVRALRILAKRQGIDVPQSG